MAMEPIGNTVRTPLNTPVISDTSILQGTAVSWGAILAGAAGAGAVSLILAFLGFGFGMGAISPWAGAGASAATIGVGSIVWLTLTQIIAAALGGYLAGRLRVRWSSIHRDEVHFRDTAHGLLAWAVATLVVAGFLTSTLGAIGREAADVGKGVAQGAATGLAARAPGMDMGNDNLDYAIDTLLRPGPNAATTPTPADASSPMTPPTATPNDGDTRGQRGEATRLFAHALKQGNLADTDVQYLGRVIAARTGATQQEAEGQVRAAYANVQQATTAAKEAADKARKAAAFTAIWLFIALLAGAFSAALFATFGGRQRDSHL